MCGGDAALCQIKLTTCFTSLIIKPRERYEVSFLIAISVSPVCLWVYGTVCLSGRISQKPHVQTSRNFLYILAVVVPRSFSDDNAVSYVFPVCG